MERRDFLRMLGFGAAVHTGGDNQGATRSPNIVYILADDLGYGDVAALNPDSRIPTPILDRMAAEGMAFTDAHSPSAVCTPTRYGILTGRYAWRTRLQSGVLWGYSPPLIETGRMAVASLLKRHGYATACIGKWHLGMSWPTHDGYLYSDRENETGEHVDYARAISSGPATLGFDYFFGIPASLDMVPYVYVENDRAVAPPQITIPGREGTAFYRAGQAARGFLHEDVLPTLTRKAVSFIDRHASNHPDQPFFLYFALSAPHTPILPTPDFQGRSGLGPYGDFVHQCDWTVGEVLNALERHRLSQNTLVIFASDNGCSPAADVRTLERQGHYPSYYFRGYKADIWEGGHRIPFIVRWPGRVPAGTRSDDIICLTDFLATCAKIVGEKLPDNAGEDSVSILPDLLQNARKPVREAVVHHSIEGLFSIRQGNWKLELARVPEAGALPRRQRPRSRIFPRFSFTTSDGISESAPICRNSIRPRSTV